MGMFGEWASLDQQTRITQKHRLTQQKHLKTTRASAEKILEGPRRIEPVLTTKNGRIFEIW